MRYEARIRVPAAIDGAVVRPYADLMLQDPGDGEVVRHEGDAEDGAVWVAFDADDEADARMHATLLTDRATGCDVEAVRPVAT